MNAAEREEQLGWEKRLAKPAALAALATLLLIIASNIARASALSGEVDNDREFLVALDEAGSSMIPSSVLHAVSQLFFGFAIYYLFRATRARRPELSRYVLALIVVAPVLIAAGRVLGDISLLDVAEKFTSGGERTEKRAEDLIEDRALLGQALLQAGVLALGFSMVMLGLNAMRAGTLSRFMGIIAILIGVLFVIPLLLGPVILQVFWTGALVFLFLDRWPGGRGPAWETGEAEPWPSAAQLRAEAVEAQLEEQGPRAEEPEGSVDPAEDEPGQPQRRKRKRRRA